MKIVLQLILLSLLFSCNSHNEIKENKKQITILKQIIDSISEDLLLLQFDLFALNSKGSIDLYNSGIQDIGNGF